MKTSCYIYCWTLHSPELIERTGINFETVLGRKKKKNWGESIQWQGIQPCKDVMKGELLPLFLNGTIQSFESNKITPLAIMGDDFCTELLQCKTRGNGPCVCFPGAPGGTWGVIYELPFWSYRRTHGRGCAPGLPARRAWLVAMGQDCGQQRPFISKELGGSLHVWRTLCDLFPHPAVPGTNRLLAF